jgi:hypothetical protein
LLSRRVPGHVQLCRESIERDDRRRTGINADDGSVRLAAL